MRQNAAYSVWRNHKFLDFSLAFWRGRGIVWCPSGEGRGTKKGKKMVIISFCKVGDKVGHEEIDEVEAAVPDEELDKVVRVLEKHGFTILSTEKI
jgi:hypothetical protein